MVQQALAYLHCLAFATRGQSTYSYPLYLAFALQLDNTITCLSSLLRHSLHLALGQRVALLTLAHAIEVVHADSPHHQ